MSLNKKDKQIVRELKEYYKNIQRCSICSILYGYDWEDDNHLCPVCDRKLKQEKREEKNERR